MPAIEVSPIGPADLDMLASLFATERATRHCWCTAFCSTRRQFAAGWYLGGNRRRFEQMVEAEEAPMGLLASIAGEPAGWCACGPRVRYTTAIDGRSRLLQTRPRAEDTTVWLIACMFVAPAHRGPRMVTTLLREAVALARRQRATAIEAWPLAAGVRRPADSHVGREGVFDRLGFRCVDRPEPGRVLMRLDLDDTGTAAR